METVKAKFCSQCGNSLPPNAAFCPICGKKVDSRCGVGSEESLDSGQSGAREQSTDAEIGNKAEAQDQEETLSPFERYMKKSQNGDSPDQREGDLKRENTSDSPKRPMSFLRIVELVFLAGLVSILASVIAVCFARDSNINAWDSPNPPVEIFERAGFLSDCVFGVKNCSRGKITATISFWDDHLSGANKTIIIPGNGDVSLGALELNGYRPKRGDRVVVKVEGYVKELGCKLGEGYYEYRIQGKTEKQWRRRETKILMKTAIVTFLVSLLIVFSIIFMINTNKGKV